MYSSQIIIRGIQARSMRWAGHVARIRNRSGVFRVLVVRPEGRETIWMT